MDGELMRLTKLLFALVAVTALSACDKSNNTKDANGNCTSTYVDDHNRVNSSVEDAESTCRRENLWDHSVPTFRRNRCNSEVEQAVRNCDTYQASHAPGRTCTAYSYKVFRDITVSTTTLHNRCNSFKANRPTVAIREEPKAIDTVRVEPNGWNSNSNISPSFPTCLEARADTTLKITTDIRISTELIRLSTEKRKLENNSNYGGRYYAIVREERELRDLQTCINR